MNKVSRKLLTPILIFSLIISGFPMSVNQSFANTSENQDVDADSNEITLDTELNDLRNSIFGEPQSSGEVNLDPFLLTQQTVMDDRSENVKAAVAEVIEENFQDKLKYLIAEIAAHRELLEKTERRLAQEEEGSKAASDLIVIKKDLLSRIALLNLELDDWKSHDPRELNGGTDFQELEHMVDESLATRHYWGSKLRVSIINDGDKVIEVKQQDFTQSMSPHFDHENPLGFLDPDKDYTFELLDPKGRSLNQFNINIQALFFFGNFLVFIEKQDPNARSNTLPIRYIDLNYFRPNVGNAPLPVYTMPLKIDESPKNITIKRGMLSVDGAKISVPQLSVIAKTHQMIFNTSVALVDSSSYKRTTPVVESITKFFTRSMQRQSELFQTQLNATISADTYLNKFQTDVERLKPIDTKAAKSLIEQAMADGKIDNDELKKIKTALNYRDSLGATNRASFAGRKFLNRLNLFIQNTLRRRPEGAPTLRNAILIAASRNKYSKEERERTFESRGSMSKIKKFGLGAVGAVAASSLLPDSHFLHISQSLDLASATHQHFIGYLEHMDYGREFGRISKDAFVTVTGGIFRLEFIDTYLSDGKWVPFFIGIASLFAVIAKIFLPVHLIVNSWKILINTAKEYNAPTVVKKRSVIKSFIRWANKDYKGYWLDRAASEKESSGSDVSLITAAEEELLHDELERLRNGTTDLKSVQKRLQNAGRDPRFIKTFHSTLKGFKDKLLFVKKTNEQAQDAVRKTVVKDIDSFFKGLSHAFLSYASLSNTFVANSTFWNKLFFPRSFYYRLDMYLMVILYPNYARVAAGEYGGKQHFPTVYNSGLESWPQKLKRVLSKTVSGVKTYRTGAGLSKNSAFLMSAESLKNLEKFEQAIGKLELLAMEVASLRAQKALIEYVKDPDRILAIFSSNQTEHGVSTGISTLHDQKLKRLKRVERTFYRAYYNKTFDFALQRLLNDLVLQGDHTNIHPDKFAKEFVKHVKSGDILADDVMNVTDEELAHVEQALDQHIDSQAVFKEADKVATEFSSVVERTELNFRHNLLKTIHPGNPQIKRQQIARMQVKKPRALDRAVRMEVANWTRTIPISLGVMLLLYSGVDSGFLQPFDPEGLNTETHRNYLNRYHFYNNFLPGLVLGLLANTWMKLQMDFMLDSQSGFDKAILHKDEKKGFWRFFMKNFSSNPGNKWKTNQIFLLRLQLANTPAFLLTTVLMNAYGLGYLEIGAFFSGVFVAYLSIMPGFGQKIENAFELSSSWIRSKIPRKLRAHPDAQKYIDSQLQSKKNAFTWYMNLWEILVQENIFGSLVTLKENTVIGTRAFLRLLFGGETPTALLVNAADKMTEAFNKIPGVESTLNGFKHIISNNYTAFERFPEDLPMPPNGQERLTENPSLPENSVAEFLGKFSGFSLTVGSFTLFPYFGSYILDIFSRKKVQENGRLFKKDLENRVLREENERLKSKAVVNSTPYTCKSILK